MTPSKRTSQYLAAVKIPVTVLCLFGAALAAYYFFYVTLHQTYLIERNFRLLATIGDQIVATIDNDRRVIQSLLEGNRDRDSRLVNWNNPQNVIIQSRAASFIPFLRSARIAMNWDRVHQFDLQLVETESRQVWMRRNNAVVGTAKAGVVQLELAELVDPLLRVEVGKGIFDALLIAAPDGRVLFQSGDSKLRIAQLDHLTAGAGGKTSELAFQGLARAPSMVDVIASGAQYKLFTQPCCAQMIRDPAPATPIGDGWVLCGLISQRTLSADSYAISFSSLILLSAALLFGLLSWPFLKLTFLGEGQRVRVHDVVLVAVCMLVGIALVTIGALDYFAYNRRLQAALDGQLGLLARDINTQAASEIRSATKELDRLDEVVRTLPAGHDHNLAHSRTLFEGDTLDAYPFFDSFSLIDENGRQQEKLTLGSVGTLFIDVGDREYFRHWTSAPRVTEPFLESIRSSTTGERQAVVSKPLSGSRYRVAALSIPLHALIDPVVVPGFGFAVIDEAGKVLFHSDPQHNLSEDFFVESDGNRRLRALVSARHEELVDIQYWGDDHRAFVFPMSIGQRWTLVTFYDRDLIRTVNVEWLILTLVLLVLYTGAQVAVCLAVLFFRPRYRAPWLWPDPARSRDYVDLLPPLALLVAAFALAIAALPVSALVVTAWLVPLLAWLLAFHFLEQSPRRLGLTWAVGAGLLVLAGLQVLALRANGLTSRVALVAAFSAVALSAALPRTRPSGGRRSPLALPVNVSYGLVAGLSVVLTAVLPAAAFFKGGHALQIESFIKYGQLQVALDRLEDQRRDDELNAKQADALIDEHRDRDEEWADAVKTTVQSARDKSASWGVYQGFFFATEPAAPRQCADSGPVSGSDDADRLGLLPELLEELLPFYSESSVHLRELVHDRTGDARWSWRRSGSELTFCMPGSANPPLRSIVPHLFTGTHLDRLVTTDRLSMLVLLGLIAVAILWVVRFALHKVFVIDVIEPLWSGSSGAVEQVWGPNLFLIAGRPLGERPVASNYSLVDLARAPEDQAALTRWCDEAFERLAQSPAGQNVLILNFEHRLQDSLFSEARLAFVERILGTPNRTMVIVSAAPPGRFTPTIGPVPPGTTAADRSVTVGRWTAVLSRFTVVPVVAGPSVPQPSPPAPVGDLMTAGWREVLWRLSALGFAHAAKFLDDEGRDPVVDRLWKDVLPYAWLPDRPALNINQLLVEVGERSENHYREIWESCTPAEKLVLGQIAEEGLVNQKTERTVRMLMARGLVRRQPNFVVMNESFRQFVISTSSHAEVTAMEEQATSTWDAIRWPFLIVLVGSLTFFFATQHELFNTALGILTGLAATLPALVKMASLFTDRKDAR